jgi:hypothetical protein
MERNSTDQPQQKFPVRSETSFWGGRSMEAVKIFKATTFRALLGFTVVGIALCGSRAEAQLSTNEPLFCDYFTQTNQPAPASPWITYSGNCTVQGDELCIGANSLYSYGHAYITTNWTDCSVQAHVKFPEIAYGAGLGGRLDETTGAHYAVWVYPEHSIGKSNLLRVVKFSNWGTWTLLKEVQLAAVGTNTHSLKLCFFGNRIIASFDEQVVADVTDDTLGSGGITAEMWANGDPYIFHLDDVMVNVLSQAEINSFSVPTPPHLGAIEKLADGNMHLVANGEAGRVYHLQASGDLGGPTWSEWCIRQDLNLQPSDPKSEALSN